MACSDVYTFSPTGILNINTASSQINISTNGSTINTQGNDLYMHASNAATGFGTPGNLLLQTNTTTLGTTNFAGNVGIGTTGPATKLQVQTPDANFGITHTNGTVSVGTYVGSSGGWLATKSNSPLYFCTGLLGTNGSAQMTLLLNGNVGIGTINPLTKLQVQTIDGSYGITHTNGTVTIGTYVGNNGGWLGTQTNHPLYFFTNNSNALMTIATNGNVGIGTISPAYKLSVNGTIQAKEVRVETGWSDFVFEKNYKLRTLADVEKYINENHHLPDIASAKDIRQNGLPVAETQTKMMQKIEELTLYVIQLQKEIDQLKAERK
jgi:hypothetical protein